MYSCNEYMMGPVRKRRYNMEKLLEILKSVRADVDFANEERLVDDGIIDSFDVVSIVGNPEKLKSIEHIEDAFRPLLAIR